MHNAFIGKKEFNQLAIHREIILCKTEMAFPPMKGTGSMGIAH
jgi:hypothetical protein